MTIRYLNYTFVILINYNWCLNCLVFLISIIFDKFTIICYTNSDFYCTPRLYKTIKLLGRKWNIFIIKFTFDDECLFEYDYCSIVN